MEVAATRNSGEDLTLDKPRNRNLFRDESQDGAARIHLYVRKKVRKCVILGSVLQTVFAERFQVATTTECNTIGIDPILLLSAFTCKSGFSQVQRCI